MITARIARRLLRKLIKPVLLWLNARELREAEDQADFYMHLRRLQLERAARLVGRRNEICNW